MPLSLLLALSLASSAATATAPTLHPDFAAEARQGGYGAWRPLEGPNGQAWFVAPGKQDERGRWFIVNAGRPTHIDEWTIDCREEVLAARQAWIPADPTAYQPSFLGPAPKVDRRPYGQPYPYDEKIAWHRQVRALLCP